MQRNLTALSTQTYDLVVVGGGIFGCCAAWDAASRGLSVALVEKTDFCHATSANCFKIVHGGLRYLQHLDMVRMRESSRERNALLRIAPHLVQPLPIVIPTYGHGINGKEALGLAMMLYGVVVFDRNQGITDAARQLPLCRFLSKQEVLDRFPALEPNGLTGGVIMFDAQMYSPPRLALSFVRSAANAGAEVANYVEATGFLRSGSRVIGVKATDILTGATFDIQGKVVLNAAGPWAEHLFAQDMGFSIEPQGTYSRDAGFVVSRRLLQKDSLALQARTKDPDAVLKRKARHLFVVPWREYTLIGVWHLVHEGPPEAFTVTAKELENYIDEVNEAYPAFELRLDDVSMWNAGLVLFGENKAGATDLSFGKRSLLIDHSQKHGIEGLITLIGVRYTTARGEAKRAIDYVYGKLGRPAPQSFTATTPIYGGDIGDYNAFLQGAIKQRPRTISDDVMSALVHNYGSEYSAVLRYLDQDSTLGEQLYGSNTIKAEVINAVCEEMAQTAADVVFRRTDLGTGAYPGEEALQTCIDVMSSELKWDHQRKRKELENVKALFPFRHCQGSRVR